MKTDYKNLDYKVLHQSDNLRQFLGQPIKRVFDKVNKMYGGEFIVAGESYLHWLLEESDENYLINEKMKTQTFYFFPKEYSFCVIAHMMHVGLVSYNVRSRTNKLSHPSSFWQSNYGLILLKVAKSENTQSIDGDTLLMERQTLIEEKCQKLAVTFLGSESDEAWKLREEFLTDFSDCKEYLQLLAKSLDQLDSERAWDMREKLYQALYHRDDFFNDNNFGATSCLYNGPKGSTRGKEFRANHDDDYKNRLSLSCMRGMFGIPDDDGKGVF